MIATITTNATIAGKKKFSDRCGHVTLATLLAIVATTIAEIDFTVYLSDRGDRCDHMEATLERLRLKKYSRMHCALV